MFDNPKFSQLIAQGNPTGQVIGVDRSLITVQGLGEIGVGALLYFDNGHTGIVRQVLPDTVKVLNLTAEDMPVGTLAVLQAEQMLTGVGQSLVGRVITPLGAPLDGKGPLTFRHHRLVFAEAPGIIQRAALTQSLPTGVAIADQLFPIVKGQRIAVLGDNKTGKTAFTTQLTLAQAGSGRTVIHVLIAKRQADIDHLITKLTQTGALQYSIVIVASIFDSLAQSYLAPYVGAAIAEHFWQDLGQDTIIIYDDLTGHAKVYRELSLLMGVAPGRASYPGDMFYAHSSLLERAGRLAANNASLTAIPVVLTPQNDITGPLPTSIMSITDGQLIFDADAFRSGIRPALSVSLSVSRVGGVGQNQRQKAATTSLFKHLAAYRQAAEYSHFGSELGPEGRADLELGKKIYEALKQAPDTIYSQDEQDLIIGVVLASRGKTAINVDLLRRQVKALAGTITPETDWDELIAKLLAQVSIQEPAAAAPAPAPTTSATTSIAQAAAELSASSTPAKSTQDKKKRS